MRRALLSLALAVLLTGAARAAPPMETNQLVDGAGAPIGTSTNPLAASPPATGSISVVRTSGIGTTGTVVSAADPVNRRTVANVGTVACEVMPGAAAYGTGYPLPVGGAFTFDSAGRTAAAIFVACSAAGGAVAVMSY